MSQASAGKRRSGPKKLPETVSAMPEVSVHEAKEESNPFTTGDWRMRGYAWAGFTLRILFIAGALFTVVQYLQTREEKRVERTLQLVDAWERPENQEAQRAMTRRLAALNQQYAGLLGNNPSENERAVYYERIGMEAMKESGGAMPLAEFRDQFDRIVYFLNRLAFCVEGNLCSREIADDVFLDFARSFWRYFSGYIDEERRRGSTNLAAPLEGYITAPR